jgi:DNA-binding protein Fis
MKKLSPEELAAMFEQETLLPLEQEFSIAEADDPVWAAETVSALAPARRRQFLCEKVEDSYKALLAAAKDGPNRDEAMATLARAVDANLRWARNNIAGFGLESEEFPLFIRIEELSVQYEIVLRELDKPPAPTLETVSRKVDVLHMKADAIRTDTTDLKVAVPATIAAQANTIRDRDAELARLKAALSQRIADLFIVYQNIAPPDMSIFLAYMREGNQVKTAASLGLKEQTLRARVAKWPTRGAAYARMYNLYQWRKETRKSPKEVPFFDALQYEDRPAPDVDAHILQDIAEIVQDLTPTNLEIKREALIDNYLKEYVST